MNKYEHKAREVREIHRREKMCLNKKIYETKEAAYQKGQRVYKCKYCGKWHRSGQFARFLNQIRNRNFLMPIRHELHKFF